MTEPIIDIAETCIGLSRSELELREKRSRLLNSDPNDTRLLLFVELERGLLRANTVYFEEKSVLPVQCISVATLKATKPPLSFNSPLEDL